MKSRDLWHDTIDEMAICAYLIKSAEDKKIVVTSYLNFDYEFVETPCLNPQHQMKILYGMAQMVTKTTRVTGKSSTLIDVILTTIPFCDIVNE